MPLTDSDNELDLIFQQMKERAEMTRKQIGLEESLMKFEKEQDARTEAR